MNTTPKTLKPVPDWTHYSKFREIRLWKAILLTMNIQPTKEGKALAFKDPKAKKEYQENIIEARNALTTNIKDGRDGKSILWLKEHPNNGSKVADYMVDLHSLILFANIRVWDVPKEMKQSFQNESPRDIPQDKTAEARKIPTLQKIIAALTYHLRRTTQKSDLRLKDILSAIEKEMDELEDPVTRETIQNHVNDALTKYPTKDKELRKRLFGDR